MSRPLAYCAFLQDPEISLPETGVGGATVQVMEQGALRLLWSEVEWPLRPEHMQKHAVEFHGVVSHIFQQKAVVPFRLLSVFDNADALTAFIAEHTSAFISDLQRLSDVVQMECVIYPAPAQAKTVGNGGADYLRQKAGFLRSAEAYARAATEALAPLGREIRARENRNGVRIFVLTERGRESEFRQAVSAIPIPEHLSRRVSGPWPAAEFLSEQVRTPNATGVK